MGAARVPAIERASKVLGALARSETPLAFSDLALETGLPRSSLHDLLASLTAARLVDMTARNRYEIGLRVIELAGSRLANSDVVSEFIRVSDRETVLRGQTLVLGLLDGADTVYVATRPGTTSLAISYRVGMRLPASCTATGKSILATLPLYRLAGIYSAEALPRLTDASLQSFSELRKNLEIGAHNGYWVDDEETAIGMICVGAPIFQRGGSEAAGAVATSLVKAGLHESHFTWVAQAVVGLANEITTRLGAEPTPRLRETAPPRQDICN